MKDQQEKLRKILEEFAFKTENYDLPNDFKITKYKESDIATAERKILVLFSAEKARVRERIENMLGITFDPKGQIEVDIETGRSMNEYLKKSEVLQILK